MGYSIDLRRVGAPPQAPDVPFALAYKLPSLSDEQREENKQLISVLLKINPALDLVEKETVQSLSDKATGVQINFYPSSGAITVPFWPENESPSVLAQISRYVQVITQSGLYTAYDPQTGQEVSLREGSAVNAQVFDYGISSSRKASQQPWWKFW